MHICLTHYLLLPPYYFQTFTGNVDRDTVVTNRLPAAVTARCLRLFPVTWVAGGANVPCLRMEVYGC